MTEKEKAATPPARAASDTTKEPLAGGIKGATTTESTALPPEAYMTEQEKAGLAGSAPQGAKPPPAGEITPTKKETK
jgi:hypothetical protein